MAERDPIDPATQVGASRGGGAPASDFADAPPEVRAAFQIPARRFGKFVLIDRLGAGGMGEVWRAWQRDLGRWVALKFLKGGDPGEVARFVHEARTAAKLSHPNIVATYEASDVDGRHYIAMDLLDGRDLSRETLAPRQAAEAIRDAARAVHHANELGIVHRDLKPSNLFRTSSGRIVVTDFGLARSTASPSGLSRSGDVVGTPQFMSPEQVAAGKSVGPAADVYGLGATLYALLTGRPPFVEGSLIAVLAAVIDADPVPVRRLNGGVDRDLETVVQKAMEKTPERRYASAAAMADDLDRYLRGESVLARPAGVARRLFLYVRRRRAAAAATTIVVATFVTLAAIWYFTPGTIQLKVSPKGASVSIDGSRWTAGAEPIQVRLRDGVYPARFEAPDHEPASVALWVERGKAKEQEVELRHFKATLEAFAEPGGSEIEFDGHRYGSRIPASPFDTGRRTLTAWADGCFEVRRDVALERNRAASVYAWLDRGLLWDKVTPEVSSGGNDVMAVPDVDGDGAPDIAHSELTKFVIRSSRTGEIAWTSPGGTDPSGGLYSIDLGGAVGTAVVARLFGHVGVYVVTVNGGMPDVLWRWPAVGAEKPAPLATYPLAVKDLDGDGVREVVLARTGRELVVLDGDSGTTIVRRTLPCESCYLARLEADGERLLFVGSVREGQPATIGAFDVKTGDWAWSVGDLSAGAGNIQDLNHDGRPDILWHDDATYRAYDGATGAATWQGKLPAHPGLLQLDLLTDLDGDGTDELVLAYAPGRVVAIALKDGRVLWEIPSGVLVSKSACLVRGAAGEVIALLEREMIGLDPKTGKRIWTYPHRCQGGIVTDWDGDGTREFVVGVLGVGLVCLDAAGTPKWTLRLGFKTRPLFQFPDADGDGLDEFVIHSPSSRIGLARGPRVLWAKKASGTLRCGPLIVDVDGDGRPEVIQAGQMASDSYLSCFDGATGAPRWSRSEISSFNRPPGVGDWDGDGLPDIALAGWPLVDMAQRVYAYRGRDGAAIADFAFEGDDHYATAVVRDVTGDGAAEFILPMFAPSVVAIDGRSGKRLWVHETDAGHQGGGVAGDLDGDGRLEVVTATMGGAVTAQHAADGAVMWTSDLGPPGCYCRPALFDLTDDGVPDVLLCTPGRALALDGKDGRRIWTASGGAYRTLGRPDVARSRDRGRVIVAPMSDAGLLAYAWDDRTELWRGPKDAVILASPVIADLDHDGLLEVVAGTLDGRLLVIDLDTGRALWWLAVAKQGMEGDPAVADLDGDGILDIVVADLDGGLTAVSGRATLAARRRFSTDF